MLKYNSESRKLTATFKAYRNDISIYTEDEEKDKEFYTQLLKRLLQNKIKINDITPLGCKQNVIKYCSSSAYEKREIFIIDGDINIIHKKSIVNHPRLFVLDRYCIENYLFDEYSTVKYIYNNSGTLSEDTIKLKLNFKEWLTPFIKPFTTLFIHFAIADYFKTPYKLFNANKYFTSTKKNLEFREEKIALEIEKIKHDILQHNKEEDYQLLLVELSEIWKPSTETLLTIVSGKNYLIPLLQIKTNEFKKSKDSQSLEGCKINLVPHFDISQLDKLKRFIEAAVSKTLVITINK